MKRYSKFGAQFKKSTEWEQNRLICKCNADHCASIYNRKQGFGNTVEPAYNNLSIRTTTFRCTNDFSVLPTKTALDKQFRHSHVKGMVHMQWNKKRR